MDENDKSQPISSQIIITFASPGSAMMDIQLFNVSPLQAATAAWYLEKHAEEGLRQQEAARRAREELSHIAVPEGVRRTVKQ